MRQASQLVLTENWRRHWLKLCLRGILPMISVPPLAWGAESISPVLKIACLSTQNSNRDTLDSFRIALRSMDSTLDERLTFTIDFAGFDEDRLRTLATRIHAQHPDLILCFDLDAALAALATRTSNHTPIVFRAHDDPLAHGLIESYARPGRNVTGITTYNCTDAKLIEVARDAFPHAARIAFMRDPILADGGCHDGAVAYANERNIKLIALNLSKPEDLDVAFEKLTRSRVDVVIVLATAVTWNARKQLIARIDSLGIPALYEGQVFVDDGGLMQFSARQDDIDARLASIVSRILRGAVAGNLPVEVPMNYELVVNFRAKHARQFHLNPSILRRADRILE